MRLIKTSSAKPGMVLARPVYGPGGMLLLRSDMELTSQHIKRLLKLGIFKIYIKDCRLADIELEDLVSDATRAEALSTFQRALSFKYGGLGMDGVAINMGAVGEAVDMLLGDIRSKNRMLVSMLNLKTYDDYTFAHSVNCCMLAIIMGLGSGYEENGLRELGVGALLHDIGKLTVSQKILGKQDKLKPEEFELVKVHAQNGYNILQEAWDVADKARVMALEHHERADGSGYPQGLFLDSIQEFGRIASIIDVYDALTSERSYREACFPHEALSYLKERAPQEFDPFFLERFCRYIAPYPVGSEVKLSDGSRGVVVRINSHQLESPAVRLLQDFSGKPVWGIYEIDLARESGLSIRKAVCS